MRTMLIAGVAILTTALYLVPTGAHLFELPHKMALSPIEYMLVQRIYAGWQWFGLVIAFAILATAALAVRVRRDRKALAWSIGASMCLVAALADFFAFTYPVNIATGFWTILPERFEMARRQWEYSHAAAALLTFAALIANVVSLLVLDNRGRSSSGAPM